MHHGRCHWSRALCRVSGRACSCKKRPCYQNVENTSDNESNNEESSSDIENQEEEEEEVASENGVEAEAPKRATTTPGEARGQSIPASKIVGGLASWSVQLHSPGTALTAGGWIRPGGRI